MAGLSSVENLEHDRCVGPVFAPQTARSGSKNSGGIRKTAGVDASSIATRAWLSLARRHVDRSKEIRALAQGEAWRKAWVSFALRLARALGMTVTNWGRHTRLRGVCGFKFGIGDDDKFSHDCCYGDEGLFARLDKALIEGLERWIPFAGERAAVEEGAMVDLRSSATGSAIGVGLAAEWDGAKACEERRPGGGGANRASGMRAMGPAGGL